MSDIKLNRVSDKFNVMIKNAIKKNECSILSDTFNKFLNDFNLDEKIPLQDFFKKRFDYALNDLSSFLTEDKMVLLKDFIVLSDIFEGRLLPLDEDNYKLYRMIIISQLQCTFRNVDVDYKQVVIEYDIRGSGRTDDDRDKAVYLNFTVYYKHDGFYC